MLVEHSISEPLAMVTANDLSSGHEGVEPERESCRDMLSESIKVDTDAFGLGMEGSMASTAVPMKQKIMARAGQIFEPVQGRTIVDLVSDDDSWDDWGNASMAADDVADEHTSSIGEGSLFNGDESDIENGDIVHDTIAVSDHGNVEAVQSDVAPLEESLPSSIRALLDEWYVARGSQCPPPCAVGENIKNNLHRARTGAAATYLHRCGETLTIALYPLPECAMFGKRCVMVARGTTKGPFAIAFVRGKRGGNDIIGLPYFIWEGVRAKDPNGWEEDSSVTKHTKFTPPKISFLPTNGLGSLHSSGKVRKVERAPILHTGNGEPDSGQPTRLADNGRHNVVRRGSTLPKHIMEKIEAWLLKMGPQSSLPFTTQYGSENLKYGKGGRPAHFVYKDGSPLDVRIHTFVTTKRQSSVIIARGAGLEPSIISSTKSWSSDGKTRISTLYRVWIGLEGDDDGFAEGMPVAKCVEAGVSPETFRALGTEPNSSHKRTPVSRNADSILGKRSHADLSSLPKSVPFKKNHDLQKLDGHILNNAVMLFYTMETQTPRVRLLSACNSTEKFFAQALAGEVFERSAGRVNILSVRLPGLQRLLHVVENDEEDFKRLIEAIKHLQCWSEQAGEINGSCTVEVRARS